MRLKTTSLIIAVIIISGFAFFEISNGTAENFIFNQIPYNYTSHIWIPPNSDNGSSLGGFYSIQGKGKDFNFHIVLPGAEEAESPLDYTKEGLNGTGKINNIHITQNTLYSLLSGDLVKAMFSTQFDGNYNMSCAAWTGNSFFINDGNNLTGTFKINGQMTYWEGSYIMKPEGNRIAIYSDYIYHPNNMPEKAKRVNKVTYM
ncbi:MAG: hypothetical protein ACPK7O_05185 [Methanobacterium sp.]